MNPHLYAQFSLDNNTKNTMEIGEFSSINDTGKTQCHIQMNEMDLHFIIYTKINSK